MGYCTFKTWGGGPAHPAPVLLVLLGCLLAVRGHMAPITADVTLHVGHPALGRAPSQHGLGMPHPRSEAHACSCRPLTPGNRSLAALWTEDETITGLCEVMKVHCDHVSDKHSKCVGAAH